MQVTYHENKEGKEFCKILANRREFNYNIDGILIRNCKNQEERQDLILQIVARNFQIRHTHVIAIANKLGKIAKKTIEKELQNWEDEGLLVSEKDGDSPNALRKWAVFSPDFEYEKQIKKEVKSILESFEKLLFKVEKNYKKSEPNQRDLLMADFLYLIHGWQCIINVTSQETRKIKQDKKRFDALITKAYKILQNDERDVIDGRPFLRRLLHLKTSASYQSMQHLIK